MGGEGRVIELLVVAQVVYRLLDMFGEGDIPGHDFQFAVKGRLFEGVSPLEFGSIRAGVIGDLPSSNKQQPKEQ